MTATQALRLDSVLLIQVDKLKRRPRHIEIDESASDFPVLKALCEQGSVTFLQSIKGELQVVRAGDMIEVAGRLKTEIATPCARCLASVVGPLDLSLTLCYSHDGNSDDAAGKEELELRDDDLAIIAFDGPEIDLLPDLEQEVVMALPQQVLCQDLCKGLCHVCGINLNKKQCDCEQSVLHLGLSALKNFKVKQ